MGTGQSVRIRGSTKFAIKFSTKKLVGEVFGEVDAVEVDEVYLEIGKCLFDVELVSGPDAFACGVVDLTPRFRCRQQRAFHGGPLAGDHDGTMPRTDKRVVQLREDLFCAAHRVKAGRGEGIGDV